MAKRMLIDAAHPEETRVVVLNGNRLEEFDFESSTKKQVKGNIYLAKVTRVEPSLQAAFVEYGGNRHGFLAFSEIHPDYYRIPIGDRDRGREADPGARDAAADEPENSFGDGADAGSEEGVPIAAALPESIPLPESSGTDDEAAEDEAEASRDYRPDEDGPRRENGPENENGAENDDRPEEYAAPGHSPEEAASGDHTPAHHPWGGHFPAEHDTGPAESQHQPDAIDAASPSHDSPPQPEAAAESPAAESPGAATEYGRPAEFADWSAESRPEPYTMALVSAEDSVVAGEVAEGHSPWDDGNGFAPEAPEAEEAETVEVFGGDEIEEAEDERERERTRSRSSRQYKIQEVVKRRQIMLVQVSKEERGNKGAALTTYLSLAGRYCVLMPNTGRGGGVSRKITSIGDRRRLKDILEDLEIPEGMGVIVRTAGAERSKPEIKRDYEYLLRLWNEIRELTLTSTAPALIYEEGNLIKRSIRDLYTRDIDEVQVEGEEGYKTAKAFMRTLMPSHAKRVQPYRDPQSGLFHRFQVESQIDAIHSPVVQLRSGGYVVINQTEALVAIDVNSGRSTRERNIEETALRTNIEAADELARQLRLRDLAGLIVIDFIDMEEHRNQIAVERRLKEALKNDRARIQVGRISPFGLLEMSRQRLRPSLAEASTQPCPHCGGTGFIRSVESTALYVLRAIEEEGIRRRSAEICIYVPTAVALYILNQKRESLTQIEARYGVSVMVAQDDSLVPPNFRLERLRSFGEGEAPALPRSIQAPTIAEEEDDDLDEDETEQEEAETAEAGAESDEDRRGPRRRRRRPRRSDEGRGRAPREAAEAPANGDEPAGAEAEREGAEANGHDRDADERRRRRRGRRGGRWRERREAGEPAAAMHGNGEMPDAETIEIVAVAENEQVAAEAPSTAPMEPWSGEIGMEAASLAALAGDSAAPPPPVPAAASDRGNGAEIAAPTVESEPGIPFVSERERVLEEVAAAPAERTAEEPAPPLRHEPLPREPLPHETASHEHEAAAPRGERERSPVDEYVQTVTEKPATPRRGWWQRLTQG